MGRHFMVASKMLSFYLVILKANVFASLRKAESDNKF